MDKFFLELLDLLVNDPSFSEETHAALVALREKAELLDLPVNDPSFSEETHAALVALREKAEAE